LQSLKGKGKFFENIEETKKGLKGTLVNSEVMMNLEQYFNFFYNEEFDPGSG
jgi:hypothetical protein